MCFLCRPRIRPRSCHRTFPRSSVVVTVHAHEDRRGSGLLERGEVRADPRGQPCHLIAGLTSQEGKRVVKLPFGGPAPFAPGCRAGPTGGEVALVAAACPSRVEPGRGWPDAR